MRDAYLLSEAEDDGNVSGCMEYWACVHSICIGARARGTSYGGPFLQDEQTSNSDIKIRSTASYYYRFMFCRG